MVKNFLRPELFPVKITIFAAKEDSMAMVEIRLAIQQEVAKQKGRFIPYIGQDFFKNSAQRELTDRRILVVGMYHNCDGMRNSRNFLANLDAADRRLLLSGKRPVKLILSADGMQSQSKGDIVRPFGCLKEKAENCLADMPSECPVFKRKPCPICDSNINRCKLKDIVRCRNNRNLKCETLYAVEEYCTKPQLESSRDGIRYFNSIEAFICKDLGKPKSKKIWRDIAFMNLIQRYISRLDYSTSKALSNAVAESDLDFAKDIIGRLDPDVIVATMDCVKRQLSMILPEMGYKLVESHHLLDYHKFVKADKVYESKWQRILKECIAQLQFSAHEYELASILKVYFDKIINTKELSDAPDEKSRGKVVRCYIHRLLVNRIAALRDGGAGNLPAYLSKKKFQEAEIEKDSLRKWLDNNKSRTDMAKAAEKQIESLMPLSDDDSICEP